MAGTANSKKVTNGVKLCDIFLDGGILSNVKATLVKELIKYFLYERQQIPIPFDQLKKGVPQTQRKANPEVENAGKRRPRCISLNLEEKKKTMLLSNLTEILSQVDTAFSVFPELTQVLVILGGTIISPKESFLIKLPPPTPDLEVITERVCIKSLFRQLITHDLLGDTKPISPTNLTVLVHAPRNSGISWFKPKPTFKTPTRGRQFVYNITCGHQLSGSHDTFCDVSEVEISGIEPLDSSVVSDVALGEESQGFNGTLQDSASNGFDMSESISTGSSSVSDCTVLTLDSQMEVDGDGVTSHGQLEAETIWYQAPLVVKGYKEKLPAQKFL